MKCRYLEITKNKDIYNKKNYENIKKLYRLSC
jgi:hypothetical protein